MDLAHVYGKSFDQSAHDSESTKRSLTSCSVQSSPTSFTLEVLRFLMVDQDFLVIEITLAVVAPWPAQDLFHIRLSTLLLAHLVRRFQDLSK